ncbi:hypothetical protein [Taibaiella helva]|uniref:hypothetical protein n=1 Tax=Taibaiella helva TaxID=2301235 RepID=UPI000E56AC7B|nr:hypothetical protein [Taibaiella helva]
MTFTLSLLSQASVILPIVTGWIAFRNLPSLFRLLFYFFILALITEIQARVLNIVAHNNMPGLHIYTWIEFISFSVAYYLYFQGKRVRALIVINILLATVIGVLNAIYWGGITAPNIVSRSYCAMFITLYTLYFFYLLFKGNGNRYEWEYPMSWIATGALIYFANNLGYFLFSELWYTKVPKIANVSYVLHNLLNIIGNCLFAQSFRSFQKQKALS